MKIVIRSFFLCLLRTSISLFNCLKSLTISGLWCFVQFLAKNQLLYYYNSQFNFMSLMLISPSSMKTTILHPSKNLNWKFTDLLLVIILLLNNLGNFQMMVFIIFLLKKITSHVYFCYNIMNMFFGEYLLLIHLN